jgi:glycosyltransferase involved in cell wall biosynthesis
MRLVDINGRFLTQSVTGVQRYATELVRALDCQLAESSELRERYRFRLVTPSRGAQQLELTHIPVEAVGHLRGNPWEQLELPLHACRRLLLNLCNTAPLICAAVVTIHDASVFAVPEAYSAAFRTWYRILLPAVGRRALRVITVSNFSRDELSRRAGISASKVDVIPLGGEHVLQNPADLSIFRRLPVEQGHYILAVGSRSPHKNLAAVVKAISRLGPNAPPLVVAGGSNSRIFSEQRTSGGAYHLAGYVTDAELRALYENAVCFVFPSLYEGFGLPPLEAMACGCPAVVSNAASLPEVCGNAVLYCNPLDPDDIATNIGALIADSALREDLRGRGAARAKRFTWRQAAEGFVRSIDSLGAL